MRDYRGYLRRVSALYTLYVMLPTTWQLSILAVLSAVGTSLGLYNGNLFRAFVGLMVAFGLAVLYRYGPSRAKPKWEWVTWGSVFAAIAWVAVSILFSWYAANFGSYNKTYGSLGAVIGFMVWIWLSVIVVLVGAELNAEMEHQSERDTTEGGPKPIGSRRAKMADTVGAPA